MVKWLVIIVVVISLFTTVILGLGYLLHHNEQKTRSIVNEMAPLPQPELKQAINGERQNQSATNEKVTPAVKHDLIRQQIHHQVARNLTCIDNSQCHVFAIDDENCHVAVNQIGLTLVKKLLPVHKQLASCQQSMIRQTAICQDNLCQLQSSPL